MKNKLAETVQYLKQYIQEPPKVGIILGSGLGRMVHRFDKTVSIAAGEIPYYPESTVQGHEGQLVFGSFNGISLLCVKGRTHLYEGYRFAQVTYIVRIMSALGIKLLILTNAAGGVNVAYNPGDLLLISDHILSINAGININIDYKNKPALSSVYSQEYLELAESVSIDKGVPIHKGILYMFAGPSYETPAEIRMVRKIGADAVSMSMVPEALAAKQLGMSNLGISYISNMAAGITNKPITHQEVLRASYDAEKKLFNLITGIIKKVS
jgi:purine-nucleoside phosphorylase